MNIINLHKYKDQLARLGIDLDVNSGQLSYARSFTSLRLEFELLFIRHGETYGNCGQVTANGTIDIELVRKGIKSIENRIYQGNVDSQINQLTKFGRQQASAVSNELLHNFLDKGWYPDYILVSPLMRARDTALPFIRDNKFENRSVIHYGIREMSFGSWENKRLCDFDQDHPCHLFYREQNALVKCDTLNGENFCDTLLRAYDVLVSLNLEYPGKKLLVFSHSMFGAACCILLGRGENFEGHNNIAFDGKRKNGNSYALPNAKPVLLNTISWRAAIASGLEGYV